MEKTNKQSSDIILYDGRVVVFKMEGDVMLYVVGGGEENEILLFGVVLALRDSLSILLKFVFALLSPRSSFERLMFVALQEFNRQTHSDRKLRSRLARH